MESWTLVIASVLIIAFEVPLVLRNLQITARIIGIGAGGHFFTHANTWFTDATGTITGTPGFIASIVVLLVIGVDLRAADADVPQGRHRARRLRRRLLRRDVHLRAARPRTRRASSRNLPHYTGGVTAAQIAASGNAAGVLGAPSSSFLSQHLLDRRCSRWCCRCCCSSSSASSTRRTSPARCAATCAAAC